MPQEPKFGISGPPLPGPGRASAKAKGAVPITTEDTFASTAPDDDLSQYIVPPDPEPEPEQPSAEILDPAPVEAPELATELKPLNTPATGITTADSELVRQLKAELASAEARLAGKEADPASWTVAPPPVPKDGETVLIHVRKDGFTANGRVWYKGQELEFTVGAPNWKATCDRDGNSWLLLSEADQIRRYDEVQFGHGPWPGAPWGDERVAAAEAARGRQAPGIDAVPERQDKLKVL